MSRTPRATAFVAATLFAAVTWAAEPSAPPQEAGSARLVGRYYAGFETLEFRTCGGPPLQYWVSAPGPLRALAQSHPDAVFVVTARVSPQGGYGHLGAYAHQIQVLEARVEPGGVELCQRKERGVNG